MLRTSAILLISLEISRILSIAFAKKVFRLVLLLLIVQ